LEQIGRIFDIEGCFMSAQYAESTFYYPDLLVGRLLGVAVNVPLSMDFGSGH
jgi:hypothetical protein